jgi:hypothetical protein
MASGVSVGYIRRRAQRIDACLERAASHHLLQLSQQQVVVSTWAQDAAVGCPRRLVGGPGTNTTGLFLFPRSDLLQHDTTPACGCRFANIGLLCQENGAALLIVASSPPLHLLASHLGICLPSFLPLSSMCEGLCRRCSAPKPP